MSLRSTYREKTINAVHSHSFHNSELGAREGFLVDAQAESTSTAAISSASPPNGRGQHQRPRREQA